MKWTDRIGRRVKLRDLHIVLAVAEAGSMTRAAEELAVSYPVVSKTISELERTLGVKLFDRSTSGVEATHYGRALLKSGVNLVALLLVVAVAACQNYGGPVTRTAGPSPTPEPTAIAGGAASPSAPALSAAPSATPDVAAVKLVEFPVGRGQHPHDVAPAVDGGVWYTAQSTGELGYLDPKTGATRMVRLGSGSSPHGVIVGPDGAPWITDSGLNAMVRVDPASSEVKVFKLPGPNVNLNTAAFDRSGIVWFTGQRGYYGRLDPKSGEVKVMESPRGAGPYGITATPDGAIFYASLANSHIASHRHARRASPRRSIRRRARQGARRVWSDSKGQIWVSEWNAGQVGSLPPTSTRVERVEAPRRAIR